MRAALPALLEPQGPRIGDYCTRHQQEQQQQLQQEADVESHPFSNNAFDPARDTGKFSSSRPRRCHQCFRVNLLLHVEDTDKITLVNGTNLEDEACQLNKPVEEEDDTRLSYNLYTSLLLTAL